MRIMNWSFLFLFVLVFHESSAQDDVGMGFFQPNFYEYGATFIYSGVNFAKAPNEHMPTDSISYTRLDGPIYDIKTAPPYLIPAYMKMDYEMLYFKIITIYKDWLEIEVNKLSGQTALVDRSRGTTKLWSEFLLQIHSVELLDPNVQELRVKPLDQAGEVKMSYEILQPLAVRGEWLKVVLKDKNYQTLGEAWLKWRSGTKLLINYSFLS